MANSSGRGGFQKGQSGNPGGRAKVVADVRELARAQTTSALRALVEIIEDQKAPAAARIAAANSLLDRGYGKPEAKLEANIISARVIRAPKPCKSPEEWSERYGGIQASPR
jgi:hypothetical protein